MDCFKLSFMREAISKRVTQAGYSCLPLLKRQLFIDFRGKYNNALSRHFNKILKVRQMSQPTNYDQDNICKSQIQSNFK